MSTTITTRKRYLSAGGLALLVAATAGLLAIIRGPEPTEASALERFRAVKVAPSDGPNILLICVDTLRADHVGLYGYPRRTTPQIDAFFSRGRIFETAYASAPSTGPSVVSFLTGHYPHRHGVRLLLQKLSPDVITAVDHLRRAGYQTAAVISNGVLSDAACGLGARFDSYDDDVDEQEPFREEMYERKASRTTDAAIHWLRHERSPTQPHFLWVHYIDPHGPYHPPPDKPVDFTHDTPRRVDLERVPPYSREPDLNDGLEYVDRYDEEIAYTDREVGRLLEEYAGLELVPKAAIIFTSDHGESMMDHEFWFRHQVSVYEEMVRVPLIIRAPSLDAAHVGTPVSLTDLAPTFLALAGLPIPDGLDGRSLLAPPRQRDILCESRAKGGGLWRALIRGRHKTMARHGMSNVIRESLAFDLTKDPQELNPLPVEPADVALRILEQLIASDRDPGGVPQQYLQGELPGPGVAPSHNAKILEKLKSLGYLDH